jgi:microtubule-associated protein-like 6
MYGGHSSHVMNVKWLADERWAVSVGGRDRAVFQWRLVPPLTQGEKAARRLAEQQVSLEPCDQEGLVWQPAARAVGGLCAQRAAGGRCR